MQKNKWVDWNMVFGLMIGMGLFHMATQPGGPLTTTFRVALIFGGIIGYAVTSKMGSRRKDHTPDSETQNLSQPATVKRNNPSIRRWLLAIAILFAVVVGMLLLARFTLPK
jgi:hypothetical protein